jgi:hypothetical protein
MKDFQTVIDALRRLDEEVRQCHTPLNSALAAMTAASSALTQIPDDPAARAAESSIAAARSAVGQTLTGWFPDYLARSGELARRIAS